MAPGGDQYMVGGPPPQLQPQTRVVGIDPGQRTIITAAVTTAQQLPGLRDQLRQQVVQPVPVVEWSSGRWHREAGHDEHERRKLRRWAFAPQLEMNKQLTPR